MSGDRPRLVYSTGPEGARDSAGGSCPRCGGKACSCAGEEAPPPSAQTVVVRRERAGRRGKTVTVAGPVILAPAAARQLLKALKRECSSGGTLKPGPESGGAPAWLIEIQGDHVERLFRRLAERGFRARRAGG